MRQRVVIAMAIACEPKVLLADEPTTALDVSVQAQILELLKNLTTELGISLVLVSHDLSVVAGLADDVLVMYGGFLAEQGDALEIFEHPAHPYTAGLLASIPDTAPDPDADAHRDRRPAARHAGRAAGLRVRAPLRARVRPVRAAAAAGVARAGAPRGVLAGTGGEPWRANRPRRGLRRRRRTRPPVAPLLEIRDLRVHYRAPGLLGRGGPPVRAVDGVSLTLRRGATLGLVGESGSGKTTLAKSLVRLEPVTSGEVIFGGEDIAAMTERAFTPVRRRIQMVFQDSLNSLNPRYTLADTLAEPFIVHKLAPRGGAARPGGASCCSRSA